MLEVDGVTRTYRTRRRAVTALEGVSLRIDQGEVLGLVGESGSGKSTLARLCVGLERPDAGAVRLEGADLAGVRGRRLRRAQMRAHLVLQDPYEALHPGMRVAQAVAEPLRIAGMPRIEAARRVPGALEEVGLVPAARFAARYPHELSGGQRQRVALARAVVGRPRLLAADEPTAMLDVSVRAGILRLLADLRDRHGLALLFITHDLAVARHISDRIAVLCRGRVVEVGAAEQVVHAPRHPYTAMLLRAAEDLEPPSDAAAPADDPTGGRP